MTDQLLPVPDWASTALRRLWPTLDADDQHALIGDHDNDVLRAAAADMGRTSSARSLGAHPGGMFGLDGLPHMKWRAQWFETPWNGWATPVVTGQTATNLFVDLHAHGQPGTVNADGTITVHRNDDDDFTLRPDDTGHFHLAELGWTFCHTR